MVKRASKKTSSQIPPHNLKKPLLTVKDKDRPRLPKREEISVSLKYLASNLSYTCLQYFSNGLK